MGRSASDWAVIERFEEATRDACRRQRETLEKILEENKEAEYLRSLGLAGRTDPESFKACIPMVTHRDLEPYIRRIADGDDSPILTGKPITAISLSSGTTDGKSKYVPFNEQQVEATMLVYRTSFAFRNREFPIEKGKALQFIYGSRQWLSPGGLVVTTATTNVYRSGRYKQTMQAILSQSCSPDEVIFGIDFHQSLYCHLLCGLLCSHQVQFVSSTFAHSIVHAFRTLELIWEDLCSDIERGILSTRITIPSMHRAVSSLLQPPNPELAQSISRKCKGLDNWYGLIPALWPNAKYVMAIMTGSMEPYLNKLRHYAADLPLLATYYGSSEGWIGINANPRLPPEAATFAVLPDIAYFEFIPLREKEGLEREAAIAEYVEEEPVGLHEVEVGRMYEIVITNFAGLYRYRLGDIVRIAGFHNTTPELQFICRRNLLLSLNIDKNTEKDLQLAVEEAAKLLAAEKLEIVDFTSCVEDTSDPGHYIVFWELSGEASEETLTACGDRLDMSFLDAGYVSSRKVGTIGPLELRVVKRGTFQRIMEHYLEVGTGVSQFKVPRCMPRFNSRVLQILCESVTQRFFSVAYD